MVVHYNTLKNSDAGRDKIKLTGMEDALRTISNVCSPTDRPISELSDIFLPPAAIADTLSDSGQGLPETDRIVRMTLFPRDTGVVSIKTLEQKHFPGRVSIGDISADGFPDILITVHYENGTDTARILLNCPCQKSVCGSAAQLSRRRMFSAYAASVEKFIVDDIDMDDSILKSVFEGRLDRLNFTDIGDDFRIVGDEFMTMLNSVKGVQYAVFFDLMEDSTIDILLITDKVQASGETGSAIKAIFNNIDMSNFFLKVRMITDELTANQVMSASFRCVITLLNDRKII